jgi:hypothetical protein
MKAARFFSCKLPGFASFIQKKHRKKTSRDLFLDKRNITLEKSWLNAFLFFNSWYHAALWAKSRWVGLYAFQLRLKPFLVGMRIMLRSRRRRRYSFCSSAWLFREWIIQAPNSNGITNWNPDWYLVDSLSFMHDLWWGYKTLHWVLARLSLVLIIPENKQHVLVSLENRL